MSQPLKFGFVMDPLDGVILDEDTTRVRQAASETPGNRRASP
jgi:hypothetical protein